jgi:hypothetical protein
MFGEKEAKGAVRGVDVARDTSELNESDVGML